MSTDGNSASRLRCAIPDDAKLAITFIPIIEFPTEYLSRAFLFDRRMLDDAVKNIYGADIQDRASFIMVRVDREENMGLVANEIDENFHNSDAETETMTESDSVANVVSAIGNIRTIIYSLCMVVLLTVLLIAANSMAMMVRDRISEVAVMRALGFTRTHIAILLFTEAALIGLAGSIIGAGLALAIFAHGIRLGEITGMLGYLRGATGDGGSGGRHCCPGESRERARPGDSCDEGSPGDGVSRSRVSDKSRNFLNTWVQGSPPPKEA